MKKETITVVILEGGKTCKEVNRFEKLNYKAYYAEMAPVIGKKATIDMYYRNNANHLEAESKLRTFETENERHPSYSDLIYINNESCKMMPGSTHQAVVVNDKMVRIV